MKASDAFPSKYIAAADLQGQDVVVKITHVATEEISGKAKFICYFAGKKKGLVLNKTNWNTIVRITGMDDSDDWTGAEICLFEAMVDFQGDQVAATRVKAVPRRPNNITSGPARIRPPADNADVDYVPDRAPPRDPDDQIGF